MILAQNNVRQFTIEDFVTIVDHLGFDRADIFISPVFKGTYTEYYLIEKNSWKPIVYFADNCDEGRVLIDTERCKAGGRIIFKKHERYYDLWLRRLKGFFKNVF